MTTSTQAALPFAEPAAATEYDDLITRLNSDALRFRLGEIRHDLASHLGTLPITGASLLTERAAIRAELRRRKRR